MCSYVSMCGSGYAQITMIYTLYGIYLHNMYGFTSFARMKGVEIAHTAMTASLPPEVRLLSPLSPESTPAAPLTPKVTPKCPILVCVCARVSVCIYMV
jgi:hypothetical protein